MRARGGQLGTNQESASCRPGARFRVGPAPRDLLLVALFVVAATATPPHVVAPRRVRVLLSARRTVGVRAFPWFSSERSVDLGGWGVGESEHFDECELQEPRFQAGPSGCLGGRSTPTRS